MKLFKSRLGVITISFIFVIFGVGGILYSCLSNNMFLQKWQYSYAVVENSYGLIRWCKKSLATNNQRSCKARDFLMKLSEEYMSESRIRGKGTYAQINFLKIINLAEKIFYLLTGEFICKLL